MPYSEDFTKKVFCYTLKLIALATMDPLRLFKFKKVSKHYADKEFVVLDVGCGNFSPSNTKRIFPKCHYHGLDRESYRMEDADYQNMERYFEVDLSNEGALDEVPDNTYDLIIMAHVIEHTQNGEAVIDALVKKLKPQGRIYLEFPAYRSLFLPSMKGTLNFFDDATHVRLYPIHEIVNMLLKNNLHVLQCGDRRDWWHIILTPFIIVKSYLRHREFTSRGFWDPCGFAAYVYAQKR